MYRALEAAASRTKAKVHLVQAGWFGNDHIERAFKQGAKALCPSVSCHFLDGREPEVRRDIWSVGDFFTSLVDNIQETFGLAPVEAMAAGLPVVASDWDGYRETVRHGEDGMLIRTLMSPPGVGEVLAMRHNAGIDNYDNYIAVAALNVAVDIAEVTDAYAALIGDPTLRARMAEQGRKRARETFEWSGIVRPVPRTVGRACPAPPARHAKDHTQARPVGQPHNRPTRSGCSPTIRRRPSAARAGSRWWRASMTPSGNRGSPIRCSAPAIRPCRRRMTRSPCGRRSRRRAGRWRPALFFRLRRSQSAKSTPARSRSFSRRGYHADRRSRRGPQPRRPAGLNQELIRDGEVELVAADDRAVLGLLHEHGDALARAEAIRRYGP